MSDFFKCPHCGELIEARAAGAEEKKTEAPAFLPSRYPALGEGRTYYLDRGEGRTTYRETPSWVGVRKFGGP